MGFVTNYGFYGQDIVMAFSPPEYCRLFAQKKAYQGGGGGSLAPQDPPFLPPQAMPLALQAFMAEGKIE